jgi:tetratricopeptide (TPR) repeat protein
MRAQLFGLTLALGLAAAANPSLADDKAKAKALYDEGLKHYNLAEYPDAIKAWKDAYAISKKPLLLFNIGQAYRLDGDCKKAMTFYDSYQREEPSPKNQDELDQAVAICAKSDTKPANAGTKPAPDTKPVTQPKPITAPVADKPTPEAKPTVAQVTPPEGNGNGNGEEPSDEPATTGGGLRKAGYGVAAGGVVLGGAAIYFALASKKASDANDGHTGEWTQTQIDNETRGKRDAKLAWIGGGVGLAALAAGAVMIAIGGPKAADSSTVGVIPTRGGVAASWSFRF